MKNEHGLLLILLVDIAIITGIYRLFITNPSEPEVPEDCPQFAVICNNPDGNWEKLCQGIDKAALEHGVAVEYIESAFSGDDADLNSVYMAAESQVDGIAIFLTTGHVGNGILYAHDLGIPVVTMAYDETESNLDIFVGVDNADYGQYLRETIQAFETVENVGLIYSKAANEAHVGAVETALREQYDLQVMSRTSSYIFDASETVKKLAMDHDNLEVICCVDDNTTQGVGKAVVDWNMVNKLHIVGTGDSENILSLVEKGVVAATIVTDYEGIGSKSISALNHAHSIFTDTDIALYTITKENVLEYMEERENEA